MLEKLARLEQSVDDWLYDYAASELGRGDDEDTPEPPPIRLNYPEWYVLQAWSDYKTHGHWPRPGGFDAQDVQLVEDFQTLSRRYNWHAAQIVEDMQRENGNPRKTRRAKPKREARADLLFSARREDEAWAGGAIAGIERRDWTAE